MSADVPPRLLMGQFGSAQSDIAATERYLIRAGHPWIPVMGEFHFSRYPASEWREELLKIRSGGVGVVSSYVLWNLHEERRGVFDWSGDLNLRAFIETCGSLGLLFCLRIGPWAHGESRNGGFPDWVLESPCTPRTDDPYYLDLVRRLFDQIGRQTAGLFAADGGPIIAVQVENELYDQPDHIVTVKCLARRAGIDPPLWTATGWGHAQLPAGEVLPLFGGYSEAAWDTADTDWPSQSRAHYFFSAGRDDDSIGADLRTAARTPARTPAAAGGNAGTPFATCELGGGMFTAYHRRPRPTPEDISALSLTKIGSGSVWQGFYVFHGGTQRLGTDSTMQESHATGYPNDCPVRSYDFQAPLGEFGQFRPHWSLLRRQATWLDTLGLGLAPLPLRLPDDAPQDTADRATLRWCLRSDDSTAYLFVNNHQPVETLPDHDRVQLRCAIGDEQITVPSSPTVVRAGAHFAWPVLLTVGGIRLVGLTAQPQALIDTDDGPLLVCFQTVGIPVEFSTEDSAGGRIGVSGLHPGPECLVTLGGPEGGRLRLLVLDDRTSRQTATAFLAGRQRLVISPVATVADGDHLDLYHAAPVPEDAAAQGGATWSVRIIPGISTPGTQVIEVPRRIPTVHSVHPTLVRPAGGWTPTVDRRSGRASAPDDEAFAAAAAWYDLSVPTRVLSCSEEILMEIDWIGDVGRLYAGDQLLADQFWHGQTWQIGLRRFAHLAGPESLDLRLALMPWHPSAPVFLPPAARAALSAVGSDPAVLELRAVHLVTQPVTRVPIATASQCECHPPRGDHQCRPDSPT